MAFSWRPNWSSRNWYQIDNGQIVQPRGGGVSGIQLLSLQLQHSSMAVHKLAVIIKSSSNNDEILLVRQTRPPKFGDEEYDSYLDSDLWDLPSAPLSSFEGESKSSIVVEGLESCLNQHNLSEFDLNLALNQVLLNSSNFS